MVDYVRMFSKDEKITKYFFYVIERLSLLRNSKSREWSLELIFENKIQQIESEINFHLDKMISSGKLNSKDLEIVANNVNLIISILDSCYVDNTSK